MAATKQRTGVASWKKLISEAESLRGQSGVNAHRRATILVQLYNDVDFRAERNLSDDDAVEEVFDDLVQDLCVSFAELRAMLQEFPDEIYWADGKLSTLYDQAVEYIRYRRKSSDEDKPTSSRRRITTKEYDSLAGEKQDIEARLKYIEKTYNELVAENQQLRITNATLMGRIEQLEKMQGQRA